MSLCELCCAPQGCGHSSAGGHPGSSLHPGLLVLQEEEWLQNNQGETIILPLLKYSPSHFIHKVRICLYYSN